MQALDFTSKAAFTPVVQPSALDKSPIRLGQILVDQGLITHQELRAALVKKYRSGAPLGEVLLENYLISEVDLARAIASQWSLETVDLSIHQPDVEAMIDLDAKACAQIGCVPWRRLDSTPVIVLHDPNQVDEAKKACGLADVEVMITVSTRTRILTTIEQFFRSEFEQTACETCPEHLSARNWNVWRCMLIGIAAILVCATLVTLAPKLFFWLLFSWILCVNMATGLFRLVLVGAEMSSESSIMPRRMSLVCKVCSTFTMHIETGSRGVLRLNMRSGFECNRLFPS